MLQWLKNFRVAVAVFFFLAVSFIFLDFGNISPSGLHTFLVSTQLVPSLIRTLILFNSASIGLFFVLLLTFLFGRVYCSTICPLGILQDISIRVAQRVNRRRRFKFKKPSYTIHYVLFLFTAVFAFSGSLVLLNLIEPFSNYGRILSNLVVHLLSSQITRLEIFSDYSVSSFFFKFRFFTSILFQFWHR